MEKEKQTDESQSFTEAEKYQEMASIKPETEPPAAVKDLKTLKRPGRAIKTSSGIMFSGKEDLWGRDSAITGEDLMKIEPEITEDTIIMLAQLQGTNHDRKSGEEPGRILTEHRKFSGNKELPFINKNNFIESRVFLSAVAFGLWQKRLKALFEYTNYYSSDTTPLFVDTTYKLSRERPEILDKEVEKKDKSKETLKDSVIKAAEYIESTVGTDGLIRTKEENMYGNQFRYWRDSPNSYRDEKGEFPNVLNEMVILDIQSLSAQALREAAEIVQGDDPEKAEKWFALAETVRRATIDKLWLEDEKYFAFGMDTGKDGELKTIKTIQSNPGWLLNSDFFDQMNEQEKEKYMKPVIERLFSDEFLTNAGIRCRSVNHADDRDFADYHGSWVSWPMETYMIAKGLRRQGFDELAEQLEIRIINSVNMAGVNYEFFVIDKEGRILLDPRKTKEEADKAYQEKHPGNEAPSLDIELSPEHTIGWTVTANLRIKRERSERFSDKTRPGKKQPGWASNLESEILSGIDVLPVYKTKDEINRHRYQETDLYIDQKTGSQKSNENVVNKLLIPTKKFHYALIGKLFRGKKKKDV